MVAFPTSGGQHLPELPHMITTRDAVTFDPRPDLWRIPNLMHQVRVIDFDRYSSLGPQAKHKLKLAFVRYLETNSFAHFQNIAQGFLHLNRHELVQEKQLERLELSHIVAYRSRLTRSTEWRLGVNRILLQDMNDWGYGICSDDALRYLRDATIKGNIKGTSIRVRDPEKGAFSDTELLAIQSKLNDSYADGEIDLPIYAMVWLFLAYGSRPIQIASLKESDLIVNADHNGARFYTLRIPRAKQRGTTHREAFKNRHCGKQVGELLELLIDYNRARRPTTDNIVDADWPLFMSPNEGDIPGFRFHYASTTIVHVIHETIRKVVGIKGNTKRFRITLAQRAVDDGKDQYTVAELLDHSDTQNVKVYYEASPATVERLDRHLAMELAPLAQAFTGHLVGSEDQALRGTDPMSRIYDKTLQNNVDRPLGTCGQMSFCGLHAPVACYTCRHFQPWVDGPHEEYLQALTEERDRMIADGYSSKIYSIKDRTILAVAEVIQLCEAEREMPGDAQ